MRRHPRHRFWSADGDPGPLAWAIASISLVLPLAGLVLTIAGGVLSMRGDRGGWLITGIGVTCIALDLLIDFVWAHPGVSASDEPDLNRRGAQLSGRTAVVVDAIEGGRGKVQIGDTVWPAEGPDAPAGARVRIVGSGTMALAVAREPQPADDEPDGNS